MPLARRSVPSIANAGSRLLWHPRRTLLWAVLLVVFGAHCRGASALGGNRNTLGADHPQGLVLANHHPQWANPANDAGLLPPEQPLEYLTLVLARSPQQQAAFEKFLADQQTPGSPEYHHWLTPEEVGERFGLAEQNVGDVTGWLRSQGLHVNWISPSRIFIGFGGTAADVGRALQTELHNYKMDGVERVSVSSDPVVPETLAPAIKAIRGLYTIDEHPLHSAGTAQSNSPELTAGGGAHFITPSDFKTIYDLPAGTPGPGITIGIVGRSRTDPADFDEFRILVGGNFSNPTEIVPVAFGGIDPGPAHLAPPPSGVEIGDQGEATLDVLRAGSTSEGANLLLVVATQASGGIEVDAQYLVQTTPVPAQIMTISFGACESAAGKSGVDFWDTLFQQAAAEGISAFVSSGDAGASGCDSNFAAPPASPKPNSPNYICSSSYATCVGGTELNDTANSSLYWSTSNTPHFGSALSYIPEGGWNEPLTSKGNPQAASSGGGVSAYIATPAWQTGSGVPAARAGRYTPDISFSAAGHDGYFGCFAAAGASCVPSSNGEIGFVYFSGTSATAPSMAGITAFIDKTMGGPQGNINPLLYQMAATAPAAFHDVTVATSGVANCSVNTPSMCNNSLPSPKGLTGGQPGFPVTNGYDLVTGLGSLDVQSLLTTIVADFTPAVTIALSATQITIAQPLTVNVTVNALNGKPVPTGTVTLVSSGFCNSTYTSAPTTLSNGIATFVIPAGSLRQGGGWASVCAKYTPDAASSSNYIGASNEAGVTVTLLNPTITVTPSSSSPITAQPLLVTFAVSGVAGYPTPTGTIDLYCSDGYATLPLSGGSASCQFLPGTLPAGNDTLWVTYTPDTQSELIYSSVPSQTPITVTGTGKYTPTVNMRAAAYDIAKAQPLPLSISVYSSPGNPTSTGTITLVSGSYSSPAATLVNGAANLVIPAETLPVGTDTIVALYAPDAASAANYNNSSGVAPISVNEIPKSTPPVVFWGAATITDTQPLQVWAYVQGLWVTGSMTVSGGGYNSGPITLPIGGIVLTIPAGALADGTDTLTAAYTPDATSAAVYTSASAAWTVLVQHVAASPVFSPAQGTYTGPQSVSIGDSTAGSRIYYTTDGTTPSASSTRYTAPVKVAASETFQAIAIATGYTQSPVVSATYTIQTATPSFSPAPGVYIPAQSVTISDATAGAAIYYTTDGSTPNLGSIAYKSAIKVKATETIQAIAMAGGDAPSAVASATYTITPPAAAPTFSPAPGTYTSVQTVSMLDATPGVSIFYTTNGSTPTATSAQYGGPITVGSTQTVKAIASGAGYSASPVGTAAYTIHLTAAAPTFSPAAGTYTSAVTVTFSDATSGATIYFTTNGTTPTTGSTKYTGPVTVSATATIKAIAVATGYANSSVSSAAYTIKLTAATPSFSLAAGTYTGAQTLKISDATSGAAIYYTVNGATPTSSSTKYTGAITVKATETIEAIAVASGYTNSAAASAKYTIK